MQKWVVICWAVLAVVGADVCPDGGLCKEGETCCNSPANGYGCCRYENVRPGVIIPSCNLSVHDNVITFIVLVLIGFLFAVRVGGENQQISIWVYVLLVTHLNQVLIYGNLTISKNKTKKQMYRNVSERRQTSTIIIRRNDCCYWWVGLLKTRIRPVVNYFAIWHLFKSIKIY